MDVIGQNANGVYTNSATSRGCADGVNHMNDVHFSYVALPSPRVPRKVRIEPDCLMRSAFSHSQQPSRVG
jgi:hypothetical protein